MHVQITDDYTDAQKVREEVFQKEQCILATLDFDGEDDNSFHFVAYNDDEEPIGTARVRFFDQGKTAKIERLAVLPEYRSKGIGRAIMESIDEYLQNRHVEKAYMHAQKAVKEFHKKFGFFQEGDEFVEADIPHVKMVKKYS
jgi:predicted GNAT family N-acyltransferase